MFRKPLFSSVGATAVAISGLTVGAFAGEPVDSSVSTWLEPYRHHHFTERGTPVVHTFNLEPAFTGRDLFLTQRYHSGSDAIEHESELELEWGITRKLGIIFELPYIVEDERSGPTERGFGDLVMVPRVMIHESERLMVTLQTEIGLPTGSNDFGGDTTLAPGIAAWADLGNWWTLQTVLGWENNLDADEGALEFGFGLIKSIDLRGHSVSCAHGEGGHHRTHAGLLTFHLEVTGEVGLTDGESGRTDMNGLIGVSHGLDNGLDIRIGYEFPLTRPSDLDYGWVIGANWHF